MRRNVVLGQLVIFAVISVLIVGYTLFDVIGVDPTASPVEVTMQLQTGGGVFDGSEVAYRGVQVGKVDSVDLHPDGVTVSMSIDEGTRIPVDSTAHVYDLSVVGEQYVDLVPNHPAVDGQVLRSGDTIPAVRTTTPVSTPTVLYDVEQLVNSIDPDDIRTVSTELAAAFAHSGPQLRQLIDSGADLVRELAQSKTAMVDLLRNGRIVLDTVAAHRTDFRTFADALQELTATLRTSTPALDELLAQAPATTELADRLIGENASAAAILLSNAVTIGRVQVADLAGLKALLVAVPEFGRLLPSVVRDGAIRAAALFNYGRRVCPTGVPLTSPISGTKSPVRHATCPNPALLPRGAANAPLQSGAAATQSSTAVRVGTTGGQDQLLGTRSWVALLAPIGVS